MSAKERLAHIKALGFTIDQEMIDRENRVDEYGQENLCNRIVADLAPEFDKFRYAIATAYTVDDEQAADAEWLGESPDDPRTAEQIDLDLWQAESALTRESDRPL